MSAPDLPVPLPPPAVEYTFAAIFLRTRQGLAVDYPLVRLDLAYQRPPDVAEHRRIFGCPLHFDQPHSQMILSDEVWDLPSRQSDAVLSEVLENHARLLLEKLPATEGFVGRVRSAIHDQLGGGDPSLAAVARALSMGERTLQRRLADEGAGFADLLDEERSRAARSYLRDPEVSLAEVAFLLGFADQSAFTRAFRRWTGVPPGRWRTENVI